MLQVSLSQPRGIASAADVQVTASKPPMDTIRDGVGRLGELNDSLKTLKIGSDASVRHKLPADLLDALLEAVAALNASLGPPAQRGRRGPPHAPSSSPIDSPLEKGEYMLFDTDI